MRPGRAREPWRDDLVDMLVRQTVLENEAWRDVFNSAKDTLKEKYPSRSGNIEKDIVKYLNKSPVTEFLKAQAYKWLKSLADNPPDAPSWFPHKAVEVAHKAFRLNGKLGTFALFLHKPTKLKFLKAICPHVEGLSLLLMLLQKIHNTVQFAFTEPNFALEGGPLLPLSNFHYRHIHSSRQSFQTRK